MKLTIYLSKKLLIFYGLITPFIMIGSLYNLVQGVILQQERVVHISPFALFGFILLPALLVITYLRNKCTIDTGKVRIGKVDYPFSAYGFAVEEYYLPFKERPLISLGRSHYHSLVIRERKTHKVVLEKELDVFDRDIEKIKAALPYNTYW